jgi:lysozyme
LLLRDRKIDSPMADYDWAADSLGSWELAIAELRKRYIMNASLLADELTRDEGLKLKPYRCTADKLTIGIGRNLDDVGITRAEARMLLQNDIACTVSGLDLSTPWWWQLSDNRQRALANMAFNLGVPGLMKFKNMLAAMNNGDFARAADEALASKWADQVGERAHRIAKLIREG